MEIKRELGLMFDQGEVEMRLRKLLDIYQETLDSP
jgi:hypothetical protein